MNEFEKLLLEEQFLSRFRATLLSTDQFLSAKLVKNKYDVEANRKRPLVRNDIKYITGVISGMNKEILRHIEKKYQYEFKSINIQEEQIQQQESNVQREEVPQQEGGGILHVIRPDEESVKP